MLKLHTPPAEGKPVENLVWNTLYLDLLSDLDIYTTAL